MNCSIKHIKIQREKGIQSGYGFVRFCQTWPGLFSAAKCVRWFYKRNIEGITVDAKFAEQFKRFLLRNRIFSEHDPLFLETGRPTTTATTTAAAMGASSSSRPMLLLNMQGGGQQPHPQHPPSMHSYHGERR